MTAQMWDTAFPYLAALLPTVAVTVLFYFIVKYILEGDRRERLAQSKWEREHEKSTIPDKSVDPPAGNSTT